MITTKDVKGWKIPTPSLSGWTAIFLIGFVGICLVIPEFGEMALSVPHITFPVVGVMALIAALGLVSFIWRFLKKVIIAGILLLIVLLIGVYAGWNMRGESNPVIAENPLVGMAAQFLTGGGQIEGIQIPVLSGSDSPVPVEITDEMIIVNLPPNCQVTGAPTVETIDRGQDWGFQARSFVGWLGDQTGLAEGNPWWKEAQTSPGERVIIPIEEVSHEGK